MTDDSKQPDRILTSAEEQAVRRQLAAVRHTDPMPVEIAGRLDDVIAGLQSERVERAEPAESPAPNVVPLASRRRHRIVQGLVAAAAVVAVGVGVTQVLGNSSSDDDAGDAQVSAENDDRSGVNSGAPTDGSPESTAPGGELVAPDPGLYKTAPEVSSGSFQQDVTALSPTPGDPTGGAPGLQRMTRKCSLTAPPEGYDALPVRYDGKPAILAFGELDQGRQRVDLYLCATGVRERSASVRQP